MTSLFFGNLSSGVVPVDEKAIRNTAVPVNPGKPAAMQPAPPDNLANYAQTDPDPDLAMDPRQLASYWHEGETADQASNAGIMSGINDANARINGQVSSSGTAADRELAGRTHKNLSYAIGIEPAGGLVDGTRMSNSYFVRDPRPVQDGATPSMTTPAGLGGQASVAAMGRVGARRAAQSGQALAYDQWWNGGN